MPISEPLNFEDGQRDGCRKQNERADRGRGGSLRADIFALAAVDYDTASRAARNIVFAVLRDLLDQPATRTRFQATFWFLCFF